MAMVDSLAARLRDSQTNPFLLMGPSAPRPGWVYRDFRPMPQYWWLALLDMLGDGNIQIVAFNAKQVPPAEFCRAQLWISPAAQKAWADYLEARQ